ncbi:MAG: FAD-dependent oxidoreductase [Burkholderiales bacterium]|nr:FAD-dependent oxidoreductase [Rhodocyclaceae bacterium]MCA3023549.1 FAD-dependent oxidoreductase [Rhodocyclaceae bacterium]
MNKSKVLLVLAVIGLITAYFVFDLGRYASLDYVKTQQAALTNYYQAQPWQAAAIFFAVYVAVTGLSLPGAAILTLAAGALFGIVKGVIIVSFASTIGATLAFLVARFILRDSIQAKFGDKLKSFNDGVTKDGAFYLFTLRLVPAFPFFLINVVMGLTPMRTWTFFWVSQVGMFLGTVVFVNAGTQLAEITSLKGILSPGLIGAFVLLGIFPIIAKKIIDGIKARKVYAPWADKKPAHFDRNVVVIGAGSAGLVTSYIAAAVKAQVTLVERHKMGGDCLNTGCVPSKALIRSAKLLNHISRAKEFGIESATAKWDFADVMERVTRVVGEIEPHDSVERYTGLGVDCVSGSAKIVSPWEVEINKTDGGTQRLTTKNIVIATGARPFVPPIPGLAEINPLTSDNVWNIRKLPKRLVVLGGGPIGCELTQCFARFGSQVTQVEMAPRIMIREDAEVSTMVKRKFESEGVAVLVNHKAKQVVVENGEKFLVVEHDGADKRIAFDEILCAVGRVANLTGFGLEELGIPAQRVVETNEYLETIYPNIFAVGDVAGPYQFTHTAAHMAWYAAVNALFGKFKKFKVDYSVVPWATFTDPEVARVGLNEQEAKEKGIAFDVHVYGIDDLDRAIADGEAHGFVKVITPKGSDKILGATIVGEHAGDSLVEFVAAMKHGFGLEGILSTIHTYPTMGEANKFAAGIYKRSTATAGKLAVGKALNDWTRGEGSFGALLGAIVALGVKPDNTPAYPKTGH